MIAWIIFLAGSAAFLYGVSLFRRAWASVDWPTAEGFVTTSRVDQTSTTRRGKAWYATIRYDYAYRDVEYEGDCVFFCARFGTGDDSAAEAICLRYWRGRKVTVYVNPDNPREAVLEPGVISGTLLVLCPGLLAVNVAVAMWVFQWLSS